jgi:AraC family transcriptional regulator
MAAQDSRFEYAGRMHRVVEYIDAHLDQALDLKTLAGVAHFSPFHFHRLFSAWTGETLGDYLRRRRVEVAAMRLVSQPRVPIIQIAFSVGFGSPEAFTRSFKGRFGHSPTSWRKSEAERRGGIRNPDQSNRKPGQAPERAVPDDLASRNPHPEAPVNVKLITRQPTTVAYLRYIGPYGEPVSRFWRKTVSPWLAMNGLLDKPRYGISYDDPSITAADQCRYDACAEVPSDFVPAGGAFKTTLPGGQYAVLPFQGTLPEVGEAWTALLRDWLPGSGLQLDARPCFEFYPEGSTCDQETGVFDCQICIPVIPL